MHKKWLALGQATRVLLKSIVVSLDLKVSLWVSADRAELRSLLANYDVTAV